MRTIKTLLFTLLAANMGFVQAAELKLPHSVNLLAVNGAKNSDKASLDSLAKGRQQIVVQYSENLKSGSKLKTYVSKPYVFELDVKNANDVYKLSHKHMRNYSVAESAFDFNRVNWRITKNGAAEDIAVEKLMGKGVLPFVNIEKAVQYHNREKGIILTQKGAVDIADSVVTVDEKTGKVEISGDPLTQLKLWYLKATPEDQKVFHHWMIDQK